MHKLASCALILTVASCAGEEPKEAPSESESGEVQHAPLGENEPPAAPEVSVTAAPGVAFNYRYAFRLPAHQIAAIQEQHAQTCERLGVSRCRITGMLYRLVNDKDIEAHLEFKLEPSLARRFGKAGAEAVSRAEGMLTESEITGEDAGAAIETANRNESEFSDDLARIEAALARPGLAASERARLQEQAEEHRRLIRTAREEKATHEEMLANTPVTFQYGSGDLVPGFSQRSPLREALRQAGSNIEGSVAVMLIIMVTLLPWAIIGLLGWRLARLLRKRFFKVEPAPSSAA